VRTVKFFAGREDFSGKGTTDCTDITDEKEKSLIQNPETLSSFFVLITRFTPCPSVKSVVNQFLIPTTPGWVFRGSFLLGILVSVRLISDG